MRTPLCLLPSNSLRATRRLVRLLPNNDGADASIVGGVLNLAAGQGRRWTCRRTSRTFARMLLYTALYNASWPLLSRRLSLPARSLLLRARRLNSNCGGVSGSLNIPHLYHRRYASPASSTTPLPLVNVGIWRSALNNALVKLPKRNGGGVKGGLAVAYHSINASICAKATVAYGACRQLYHCCLLLPSCSSTRRLPSSAHHHCLSYRAPTCWPLAHIALWTFVGE